MKPPLGPSRWRCQTWLDGRGLMIDPKLQAAQDRGEREFYERIAELYLKIAQDLEAMMGG
jgi:hypothetical protein